MDVGPLFARLLSTETLAALLVSAVVLLVYLATKVHLESKQNASEHAELRAASNRQAEEIASVRQEIAGVRQEIDRLRESTDRKLDQILSYLLRNRSDKEN